MRHFNLIHRLIHSIATMSGVVAGSILVMAPSIMTEPVIAETIMAQTTAGQLPKPRRGDAALLRPAQGKPITPTNQNEFNPSNTPNKGSIELRGDSRYYAPTANILPNNYNATPQSSVLRTPGAFSNDPVPAVQILQATPERAAPSAPKKAD